MWPARAIILPRLALVPITLILAFASPRPLWAQANLENPRAGSSPSGIGIVSGWVCSASRIDIEIDGTTFQAAYGTSRGDTSGVCHDDGNNGFGLLINWNLFGTGKHMVCALADRVEFANVTFLVATLGKEFLTGADVSFTLPDFPQEGNDISLRWEESLQNFVIAGVGCNQGPANPPSSAMHDLDTNAADWGVFCEGSPTWVKGNVPTPSLDGNALRCGITGGEPFSNVHCYRNLPPEPTATVFTLTLSFRFSPTTTFNNVGGDSIVQALEFSMNKWQAGLRYEFALQWENVGDGAPQWRYWNPHQPEPEERWVSLGITDTLEGEQWHTLILKGEIINGQVHYQSFTIDQQSHSLDVTVPPAAAPGEPDRLAIAVQLDGNSEERPYDLFIDQVSFV